ncbi:hypothetical protein DFJ58DRAFT_814331 [Suillus subalutaceus]|uniref:uncharacterized protein n=1 Tax=Suillus subalutaceus TaxID=48586 RepID=UPI001B866481|nr:uncharacterized protein DFJ58DRAFT_814331 [Suillus subalutaceus]KAG1838274.1 hypothetical protein DFJ58DRAFT_814331 [Suillus subalutaceus]
MLSKSFALFAAFAAFVPAFAAPLPGQVADVAAIVDNVGENANVNVLTRGPAAFEEVVRRLELSGRGDASGCSVADVDIIVSNVLNNDTINILSPSKRGGCDILGLTLEVTDVLNNLDINILSPGKSKRAEAFSLEQITSLVSTMAANTGKAARSTAGKRGGSLVDVTAVVEDVLNNLDINVLTKRVDVTEAQIANAVYNALISGSTSKRSGIIPNVNDLADRALEELSAIVAKRAD